MSTPTANPTRQQLDELDALLQRMLSLPLNQLDSEMSQMPPPPPRPAQPPSVGYSTNPASLPPRPSASAAPRPAHVPTPPRPTLPAVAAPPRPAPPPPPMLPRRDPSPGDHTWNVPLPTPGDVAVYGNWPMGIDAIAPSSRPIVPPPAPVALPPNLRMTTVPSPDDMNQARDNPPPMDRLRVEVPISPPLAHTAHGPQATKPVLPETEPVPFLLWPLAAIDWMIGKPMSLFGAPGRWLGQGGGKMLVGWIGLLMISGAVVWGVVDYMGWAW
jgi:hypothetical protein